MLLNYLALHEGLTHNRISARKHQDHNIMLILKIFQKALNLENKKNTNLINKIIAQVQINIFLHKN